MMDRFHSEYKATFIRILFRCIHIWNCLSLRHDCTTSCSLAQVLEVLNLSFNPLGDSCMLSLAMVLHKLSALSTLGLASCDFTQKLFQHHRLALAESMQG